MDGYGTSYAVSCGGIGSDRMRVLGTCCSGDKRKSGHGATPAYALNEIVQAQFFGNGRPSGPFTLEKTVPVPMDTLRSGNYAIVLRTTPADGNLDIFCGEIR